MSVMTCTRCNGTGFLNIEQVSDETLKRYEETGDPGVILAWIDDRDQKASECGGCYCAAMRMPPCSYCTDYAHDVCPCDCCGNGEPWGWYFLPGAHDWDDPNDPKGCR